MLNSPVGGKDFVAPEKFDSRHVTVFLRWGDDFGTEGASRSPLPQNFRMACGGSTELGGYSSFPTAPIWHYKLMTKLSVADSFILGLAQGYHVPLCISRGGAEPGATPLYDQDFTTSANPAPQGDHLHIQYPVHIHSPFGHLRKKLRERFGFLGAFSSRDRQSTPPSKLPVLIVSPTPLPSWLEQLSWQALPSLSYGFRGGSPSLLDLHGLDSIFKPLPAWLSGSLRTEDLCLKVQPKSGAVNLTWTPPGGYEAPASLRDHLLSTESLFSLLASLGLKREQWTGGHSALPDVKF